MYVHGKEGLAHDKDGFVYNYEILYISLNISVFTLDLDWQDSANIHTNLNWVNYKLMLYYNWLISVN